MLDNNNKVLYSRENGLGFTQVLLTDLIFLGVHVSGHINFLASLSKIYIIVLYFSISYNSYIINICDSKFVWLLGGKNLTLPSSSHTQIRSYFQSNNHLKTWATILKTPWIMATMTTVWGYNTNDDQNLHAVTRRTLRNYLQSDRIIQPSCIISLWI